MPNSKIENVDIGDLELLFFPFLEVRINAESKGESFSQPHIVVCSWIISCIRNSSYLHHREITLLLSRGFLFGYSYLLIACKF